MISTVSVRFTVLFYAYVVKCRKYSKGITQMEYTLKYGEMSAICCDMGAELISFRDENGEPSDKPYCIMLEPGEYKKLSYKVTVI